MSKRCTKSIALTDATSGQLTKVSFADHKIYALGADGKLQRVRHRHQLPVDSTGLGALCWVLDTGTELDEALLARASDLAALGAELRLASLLPGARVARSPQAPKSAPVPDGFLASSSATRLLGEGGAGFGRDEKSELFALLTNERVSETIYESFEQRRERSQRLIASLSVSDPDWLVEFAASLRREHKVRTASVTLAVDAIVAGHPDGRALLEAVLDRPDEPGVALRYYYESTGKKSLPASLKAGLAEAAVRLYSERSVADFDVERNRSTFGIGERSGEAPVGSVRFRDVIALCHPKPASESQAALFAHLISGGAPDPEKLPLLATRRRLFAMGEDERNEALGAALVEAREVFAGGYESRGPLRSPLSALGMRELFSWRPASDDVKEINAELGENKRAVTAARQQLRESRQELVALQPTTVRMRRAKLDRHQMKDRAALARATDPAERARLEEAMAARAVVMEQLVERSRPISEAQARYEGAARQLNRALAERYGLEQKAQLARGSGREPLFEVALPTMSYRDTLSNLGSLAGTSPEAQRFAAARLADLAAMKRSNFQLSDLMTAARALDFGDPHPTGKTAEQIEQMMAWGQRRFGELQRETYDPAALASMRSALDSAGSVLADQLLGDLGEARVLVMVDGSGSMGMQVSLRRGDQRAEAFAGLDRSELASLFAGIVVSKGRSVDVVTYDTEGRKVALDKGLGPVSAARAISESTKGGGTDTWGVLMDVYDDHDVVLVLTDEQTSWSPFEADGSANRARPYFYSRRRNEESPRRRSLLPAHAKVITCNLAGDAAAAAPSHPNHLSVAGASPVVLEGLAAAVAGKAWV